MPNPNFKLQLEKILTKAEEALNLIGYIPVISAISGAVRSVGGIIQMVSGILCALIHFIMIRLSKTWKLNHLLGFKEGLTHGLHGLANFLRAKIELVPFLSLVTCLPYDLLLKKRFKYESESVPIVEEDPNIIDI